MGEICKGWMQLGASTSKEPYLIRKLDAEHLSSYTYMTPLMSPISNGLVPLSPL